MNLNPEMLAAIQQALNNGTLTLGNPTGRSPIRPRQLHDLRLLPTKDDPRPTFFWSAESPRDGVDLTKTTEFPKLLWDGTTGTEITVTSREEQEAHLRMGYVFTAPAWVEPDPMDAIRAQFEALPPEDRALLIAAQQQDRINRLKAQLSEMPEDKLAALLASAEPAGEAKRGPGRPRKDSAA